jgi:molecular chaperone IbpA
MTNWKIDHNHLFGDLAKFDKYLVGFEDLNNRLTKSVAEYAKNVTNYPPYNIVKTDDNRYVIEMAVAGFGKHNLELELNDGVLTIVGNTTVSDLVKEGLDNAYLYKGIADRSFTRKFTLADTIEIKNAELINGMLRVWLENIIPDSKKPKKIDIEDRNEAPKKSSDKSSEKKYLAE